MLLIQNPSFPSIFVSAETWKGSKEQVKNGRKSITKDKHSRLWGSGTITWPHKCFSTILVGFKQIRKGLDSFLFRLDVFGFQGLYTHSQSIQSRKNSTCTDPTHVVHILEAFVTSTKKEKHVKLYGVAHINHRQTKTFLVLGSVSDNNYIFKNFKLEKVLTELYLSLLIQIALPYTQRDEEATILSVPPLI